MTKLLEKAFKEASKLPEVEQNSLAAWLLEELEAEKRWDKAFAESEDVLERLVQEALIDNREGRATVLDPEGL